MSTKKVLPRLVAEKFLVSISSPLFVDGSRSLERFFSGLLFRSLGSFSSSDNVRRLLKLGKRFDFVATMVLSEARGLSAGGPRFTSYPWFPPLTDAGTDCA